MNYFFSAIAFLTLCAPRSAHAQVRKTSLPADSGVLNVPQPIVPYDSPLKIEGLSNETIFACGFEQQPEFPGRINAMYKFIEANLRIPRRARKAGISGKDFVGFMVEETGEIKNVTVFRGLGFGCDEEAVRMVESMPKWKPGKLYGKPVRVRYMLPVSFVAK